MKFRCLFYALVSKVDCVGLFGDFGQAKGAALAGDAEVWWRRAETCRRGHLQNANVVQYAVPKALVLKKRGTDNV